MRTVIALFTGLLFGAGLTISRMIDPAKVIGFLDFGGIPSGAWDPSLAFVMGGALAVSAPAFYFAKLRGKPLVGQLMIIPDRRDIDWRLISGSLIFGIGWGLAGICPGPAITALTFGMNEIYIFVAAMLAGMAIYQYALSPGGWSSGSAKATS